MRKGHGGCVGELFIPGLQRGALYKYEIVGPGGRLLPLKADPIAFLQEQPPATSSRVHGLVEHTWGDADWLARRGAALDRAAPISIYEVHAGSWRWGSDGERLDYDRLAETLVPYAQDPRFPHTGRGPGRERGWQYGENPEGSR